MWLLSLDVGTFFWEEEKEPWEYNEVDESF